MKPPVLSITMIPNIDWSPNAGLTVVYLIIDLTSKNNKITCIEMDVYHLQPSNRVIL